MFNAFKFTKQLEQAGFSREQAEVQLQVLTEIIEMDLATKQDLKTLETELTQVIRSEIGRLEGKIYDLGTNLGGKIINLESKMNTFESKLDTVEYRITIKLGTFLAIGFTGMATLLKFWLVK